jgi:hypothetical protein
VYESTECTGVADTRECNGNPSLAETSIGVGNPSEDD